MIVDLPAPLAPVTKKSILHRRDALLALVGRAVDIVADRAQLHLLAVVGAEEMLQLGKISGRVVAAAAQPVGPVLLCEDHRHSIVDRLHQVVGFRGQDRATLQFAAVRAGPNLPTSAGQSINPPVV